MIAHLLLLTLLAFAVTSCQTPPAANIARKNETIVFLHGLARTPKSFAPMAEYFSSKGYSVVNHAYPSRHQRIGDLAEQSLAPLLKTDKLKHTGRVHFVTHSMGGIVLRQYLASHRPENLGRVVMLAPPNQGSEVVDTLGHWRLFKWINGPAGGELGTSADSTPKSLGPADYPVGIIAGDRSINWINSWMIPGSDDGKVSVEGTKLAGMCEHVVVHHTHPMIMRRKKVFALVERFLDTGSFHGEAKPGGKL